MQNAKREKSELRYSSTTSTRECKEASDRRISEEFYQIHCTRSTQGVQRRCEDPNRELVGKDGEDKVRPIRSKCQHIGSKLAEASCEGVDIREERG